MMKNMKIIKKIDGEILVILKFGKNKQYLDALKY